MGHELFCGELLGELLDELYPVKGYQYQIMLFLGEACVMYVGLIELPWVWST